MREDDDETEDNERSKTTPKNAIFQVEPGGRFELELMRGILLLLLRRVRYRTVSDSVTMGNEPGRAEPG